MNLSLENNLKLLAEHFLGTRKYVSLADDQLRSMILRVQAAYDVPEEGLSLVEMILLGKAWRTLRRGGEYREEASSTFLRT